VDAERVEDGQVDLLDAVVLQEDVLDVEEACECGVGKSD